MGVEVLDNVFDYGYQEEIYDICARSSYGLGWIDNGDIENRNKLNFHCTINPHHIQDSKIDEKILKTRFGKELIGWKLDFGVINVSHPGQTYYEHTHPNQKVVLYYPNLRWNREWGGETLFYDNKGKNLIFASEYKSNRLILFDGEIPHSIRAPSYLADQYRFTMSFFYIPIN